MLAHLVLLLSVASLTVSCSGDRHLPSSNPPEYDPTKVYTAPAAPLRTPSVSVAKPAEPGPPPVQLPPLEPGPNEQGKWKKVPVRPESLQLFNSVKSPCEALSKIVQGLGSTQLFAGKDGESFKQLLGSQAESVARALDQQLFDNFKAQLGPTVADCPSPTPGRKSSLGEPHHAPRRILATGPSHSSFQLAQATPSGGEREGYTITQGSVNIPIPPMRWAGNLGNGELRKETRRKRPVIAKPSRSSMVAMPRNVLHPTPVRKGPMSSKGTMNLR